MQNIRRSITENAGVGLDLDAMGDDEMLEVACYLGLWILKNPDRGNGHTELCDYLEDAGGCDVMVSVTECMSGSVSR